MAEADEEAAGMVDDDGVDDSVLEQARATVARLEAEKERVRLESELAMLNERVANLDAQMAEQRRAVDGPSAEEVERAFGRLASRADASKAVWGVGEMDR